MSRKTFYYNDEDNRPVVASGAVFYRVKKGKMELLLIDNNGIFEDIGGKSEKFDDDIKNTASREIEEETNGLIKEINIIDRMDNSIYVPRSKYELFIIEANKDEMKLTSDDFGEYELHDNFKRKIKWISKEKLLDKNIFKFKLNQRIKNMELFKRLNKIENEQKLKRKIFKSKSSKSKSSKVKKISK
jgi:hypothetical protein